MHYLEKKNCSFKMKRNTKKQGSSENDGRSDVYDHSEFKVISTCCYNNCCRTNCGHFTCIYLNLPDVTRIYLNIPEYT